MEKEQNMELVQQSIEEKEFLMQYDDKTLTTPEHDKFLIQLLNEDYVRKLFPELGNDKIKIKICELMMNQMKDVVGYMDVVITSPKMKLCIEVRPWITSFRNTMRQLRIYECYGNPSQVCLYTSDLQFKKQFEDQEIRVISSAKY